MKKIISIFLFISAFTTFSQPVSTSRILSSTYGWLSRVVPINKYTDSTFMSLYNKADNPPTGTGSVVLSSAPTVSNIIDVGTSTLTNLVVTGTCTGCGGGGGGIPYTGASSAMDFNNQLAGNFQRLTIGTPTNAISPLYVTTPIATYTGSYFTDSEPGIVYAATSNSTTNSNSHGFVYAAQFIKSNNSLANAAFTDNSSMWGTANYDHHASYQSAFSFNGSGTLGYFDFVAPTLAVTNGAVSTYFQLHATNASVTGSGSLNGQYGLYVETLSAATAHNIAIHVVSNPSEIGGPIEMFTPSGAPMAFGPEINWFAGGSPGTIKISSIQQQSLNNSSQFIFNTSNNFSGSVKPSFKISGDDTNTGTDTVRVMTHYFKVDAAKVSFAALPTVSTSLPSGYLWRDATTGLIHITP